MRACPTLFFRQNRISDWAKKYVGLYRDDVLSVINQANGPKMNRIKKDIIALFKSKGLSITIDTNLIETDFLDVSLNLEMETFLPYRKPNNTHPF